MKLHKLIALICAGIMISSPVMSSAKTLEFTLGSNTLYVSDGAIEKEALETAPYTSNDRTMVPVRIVSEEFGADVGWDDDTQTVTITDGETVIKLTIGSNEAIVNGESVILDAPAVEIGGRTMIPLRFVSETLKKTVIWVEDSSQVLISDESPVMNVNGYVVTLDDYRNLVNLYGYPIEYITSYFQGVGIYIQMAYDAGYTVEDKTEVEKFIETIEEMKDDIYQIILVAPAIRAISDATLVAGYLASLENVTISLEEITNEYNSSYIRAKHILIPTMDLDTGKAYDDKAKAESLKTAQTVLAKIKAGKDFDALINEYNKDPGVEYNPDGYVFTYGEMLEEFENAAYALNVGEVSEIVETSVGYHIIKRETLPELEEDVMTAIESNLIKKEMTKIVDEYKSNAVIEQYMTNEEITQALEDNF